MFQRFDPAFRTALIDGLQGFERYEPVRDPAVVLKRAAVCITITDAGDDAAFVLTRRASRLRNHGGQWALPGGRLDAGETASQAALRELHEEVGLELPDEAVLGLLDDYPTRSGYLITPVVVWAGANASMVANPDEVASIHRIGLDQILAHDAVDFVTIPESDRPVVRLRINDDRIHAPTAAVLYQFRELIAGRQTRVHELEQPTFAWR
ncbi:MAG: CoA pyrophosphatase [Burkholderiales bacterium]|jgi:8-oxo-dGTP pyrophosphatase MutT (NUDIX family)|nr:CoA pyrophosphatase [Burkholderiales bacterium]